MMKSIASMLFVLAAALLFTNSAHAGYADGMNQYAGYHVMHRGVDPYGTRMITLRAAAFIPKSKGKSIDTLMGGAKGFKVDPQGKAGDVNWAIEPGQLNTGFPRQPGIPAGQGWGDERFRVNYFSTDNRENPGDPGTSRISSVSVQIDTAKIGKMPTRHGSGFLISYFKTTAGVSHQIRLDHRTIAWKEKNGVRYWQVKEFVQGSLRTKQASVREKEYVKNYNNFCCTTFQVSASAGYPFGPGEWLSPNIDYTATWDICRVPGYDAVTIRFKMDHDGFPAYEAMVDDSLIYGYKPKDSGPTVGNLLLTRVNFRQDGDQGMITMLD